jgi:hypothetical protein
MSMDTKGQLQLTNPSIDYAFHGAIRNLISSRLSRVGGGKILDCMYKSGAHVPAERRLLPTRERPGLFERQVLEE